MRILTVSDLHCGNGFGLTPPKYHSGENEVYLLPFWNWFAATLEEIGPVDALVANGDLIDGDGRKDNAYHLTTNVKRQTDMAVEVINTIEVRKRFVVRGTGYHVDGGCAFEDYIADALGCDAEDDLRLEIDGVKFHWRHVVGRSDTPYGQHTQDAKEIVNDMLQAEMEDYEHADQLIRSHVHYCSWAGRWNAKRERGQECWTTPALQLRALVSGPYVRKLRTWLYHVGVLLTTVEGGEVRHKPYVCPIKLYAPEERRYLCLT